MLIREEEISQAELESHFCHRHLFADKLLRKCSRRVSKLDATLNCRYRRNANHETNAWSERCERQRKVNSWMFNVGSQVDEVRLSATWYFGDPGEFTSLFGMSSLDNGHDLQPRQRNLELRRRWWWIFLFIFNSKTLWIIPREKNKFAQKNNFKNTKRAKSVLKRKENFTLRVLRNLCGSSTPRDAKNSIVKSSRVVRAYDEEDLAVFHFRRAWLIRHLIRIFTARIALSQGPKSIAWNVRDQQTGYSFFFAWLKLLMSLFCDYRHRQWWNEKSKLTSDNLWNFFRRRFFLLRTAPGKLLLIDEHRANFGSAEMNGRSPFRVFIIQPLHCSPLYGLFNFAAR